MPITSIEQSAHIVLDNCVLSMLTDFSCEDHGGLSARQLLDVSQEWLTGQLDIIKSFAIDGLLHTSNLVSAEYKPEKGRLGERGLPVTVISNMANSIRAQLNVTVVENAQFGTLRALPNIEKRLADPKTGLTDQDLSVVHLGLDLTQHGNPVVLLTNDQDLLQYVSWVRAQRSLRIPPRNPLLLEGRNCLAYLELIHRTCRITSDQMEQIIRFAINDTVRRMTATSGNALSPVKGARIIDQATKINQTFTKSIEIKIQNRTAAT